MLFSGAPLFATHHLCPAPAFVVAGGATVGVVTGLVTGVVGVVTGLVAGVAAAGTVTIAGVVDGLVAGVVAVGKLSKSLRVHRNVWCCVWS